MEVGYRMSLTLNAARSRSYPRFLVIALALARVHIDSLACSVSGDTKR